MLSIVHFTRTGGAECALARLAGLKSAALCEIAAVYDDSLILP
jgi:hypothetical protein